MLDPQVQLDLMETRGLQVQKVHRVRVVQMVASENLDYLVIKGTLGSLALVVIEVSKVLLGCLAFEVLTVGLDCRGWLGQLERLVRRVSLDNKDQREILDCLVNKVQLDVRDL